jgi:hypothetical protein
MANGYERQKIYQPESQEVKDMGLVNPRSDITLTDGGAGSLAEGTYIFSFVEVDTTANQGEGLLSGPPTGSEGQSIVLDANSAVTITFPSGPANARATEYWVYMSLADGAWPVLGRVATVTAGTQTTTITSDDDQDFDNYPLDSLRDFPRNKAYTMKMNRRMFFWGAQELRPTLTWTIGSTEAFWASGDQIDDGVVGMVCYPDEDTRGYLVTAFNPGSPNSITVQDAFVGSTASEATSNIPTKMCRPSGELSWSEPDDYENVPLANVRYVELSGSDPETGCGVINGRGLLFTVRKTFGLNFQVRPDVGWGNIEEISTSLGCSAHNTIKDIGGILLWLSEGGIAASQGGAPRIISDEIGTEFDEIIREKTGRIRNAFAVNWTQKQRYLCFVPREGDTVGCSKAIVCDYRQLPGEPKFRFSIYTFDKQFTAGTVERHTVTDGENTNYLDYPILGDKDGYIWTFGTGDADGPSSGTVAGTVTSAASSPEYLTDSNASFDTSGLGLQGMYVTVRRDSSNGDEADQTRLIGSNTSDTLSPDQEWVWVPSSGDTYWIGRIVSFYETAWSSLGGDEGRKGLHSLVSTFEQESASGSTLTHKVYTDFSSTEVSLANEGATIDLTATGGRDHTLLTNALCYYAKCRWENERPDEPWTLKGATLVYRGPDDAR